MPDETADAVLEPPRGIKKKNNLVARLGCHRIRSLLQLLRGHSETAPVAYGHQADDPDHIPVYLGYPGCGATEVALHHTDRAFLDPYQDHSHLRYYACIPTRYVSSLEIHRAGSFPERTPLCGRFRLFFRRFFSASAYSSVIISCCRLRYRSCSPIKPKTSSPSSGSAITQIL